MTKLRLEIDEDALNEECRIQASQVGAWGKHLAEVQDVYDRAKSNLKLVYARMEKLVRMDPTSYGISKTTGSEVDAAVTDSTPYQEANEAYLNASHELGKIKAGMDALWSRDKMLGVMKDLYVHDYYQSRRETGEDQSPRERLRRDDV